MVRTLEAQYEEVMYTLSLYGVYAARISRRINYRVWLLGTRKTQDVLGAKYLLKHMFSFSYTDDELKKLINRFAKDEERTSPFFDVILSDYPYETLALQLEAKCPDIDFSKIAKLFEFRDKQFLRMNIKTLITSIVGVGLFFLNTVPDSIVEMLGGDINAYKLSVILISYSLVTPIGFFWGLYWFYIGRHRRALRILARDALGYLAIRSPISDTQQKNVADGSATR